MPLSKPKKLAYFDSRKVVVVQGLIDSTDPGIEGWNLIQERLYLGIRIRQSLQLFTLA